MTQFSTRVGVVGTGYVGLVSGACFADLGFPVICLDVVPEKVESINQAQPPIFENGLEELLQKVVIEEQLLKATLDREEMFTKSDLIFVCLPTPSSEDGSIDLGYIRSEIKEIGMLLGKTSEWKTIVVKSTVVPGTTSGVVKTILEESSGKQTGIDFGLAMNPEFLMEGVAINNFSNPDRIVIGAVTDKSFNHVKALYESFDCEIQKTTTSGAEMIKYAANSFLATKVSFINEIANICEMLGVDVGEVALGIGLDDRISPRFLRAGVGFGGSCFPKDVKALYAVSKQVSRPSNLLKATLDTNEMQPLRVIDLLETLISVQGKTIGLMGLAFKPDTDDMREAPSIVIANNLLQKGAKVKGYDPIAKETARSAIPGITHCNSVADLLQEVDAAILVTEWSEFRELKPQDFERMNNKIIIDGRRVLDWVTLQDSGYSVKVLGQAVP